MDVSVIIVNYNTLDLTKGAIQSVYQRTLGCSFEIIVVDNHSDEDPSDIPRAFKDVKFIQSHKNVGFAAGNNLGIEQASGDYILLLNSDTLLKNDAISLVFNYLRSNSDVAVASAKLEYPDGVIQHVCQRFPGVKYQMIELLRLQKFWSKEKRATVLLGAFFDHKTPCFADWVWGTFFMFNRELLKQFPNGKLQETFFMYQEDVEWCLHFSRLGFKIAYRPEAEVIHMMGGSNGPKNAMMKKNEEIFLKMHYSPWEIFLIRGLERMLKLSRLTKS